MSDIPQEKEPKGPLRRFASLTLLIAVVVSVAIHLLVGVAARGFTASVDLDFEFQMPVDVTFGMTDEMTAALAGGADDPQTSDPTENSDPLANPSASGTEGIASDAGVADASIPDATVPDASIPDANIPDARVRDARVRRDARPKRDARVKLDAGDAGDASDANDASDTSDSEVGPKKDGTSSGRPLVAHGPSVLPAGAQLAVRADIRRIRKSKLAPKVRALLEMSNDWQAILKGSGLNPLDDLDRLLIATPNGRRANLVMAGKHSHNKMFPKKIVAALSASRGVEPKWRRKSGVMVADWPNADGTKRVISLLSPKHFSITRPQDLPPVLAVAKARAERNAEEEGTEATTGPDALLSMGKREVMSFEAEGLAAFVRRGQHMPERVRVGVVDTGANVLLQGAGSYADDKAAASAARYWTAMRDKYAPMASLLQIPTRPLMALKLTPDGSKVRIDGSLSHPEMERLLAALQKFIGLRQGPPKNSPSGTTTKKAAAPSARPIRPVKLPPSTLMYNIKMQP